MFARNATLPDAFAIDQLIRVHVGDGTLLSRSLAEICENIRDFVVIEDKAQVVGCGALHLYGMHLAEVRSITIGRRAEGKGAGRILIDALLVEAARQSVTCVCLFTRIPGFFGKMGFTVVEKELLPDKMYKDCMRCPRMHACDEIAMYMGELPGKTLLTTSPHAAQYYTQLVQLHP